MYKRQVIPDLKVETYVDDPILIARGPRSAAAKSFAKALLAISWAGFPLAWNKCDGGKWVRWIGAIIRAEKWYIVLEIPQDRANEILQALVLVLAQNSISTKSLRALAGKISSIAQIAPNIRPFTDSLWGALSFIQRNCTTCKGRHDHCRVPVKRIRHSVKWLVAFLRSKHAVLRNPIPVLPHIPSGREIHTDASPWGIGGVLLDHNRPIAYFFDAIHEVDLRRFEAQRGASGFNTLWEALAVLVALRLWAHLLDHSTSIHIKSDNLAVISSTQKRKARNSKLSAILREIALDEVRARGLSVDFSHIFGVANQWPDALSRVFSPSPPTFPVELANVKRTTVPWRDSSFYKCW